MVSKVIKLFLLISLFIQHQAVAASMAPYQLMLIGSELPYCRSAELAHCNSEQLSDFSLVNSRQAIRYKVSPTQVKSLMKSKLWHYSRQAFRHDLNLILLELSKQVGSNPLSKVQLLSRFRSVVVTRGGRKLSGFSQLSRLTKSELSMLLDYFEVPQFDRFNERVKETVNLTDTLYLNSILLYKKIVEQAQLVGHNKSPNILLMTAGERDPFKNVDATTAIFNQLGANASWLPLDSALTKLLDDKASCDQLHLYRNRVSKNYNRARIYPDLIKQQQSFCQQPSKFSAAIEQADAIVFIGSSPTLLRDTLVNSAGKRSNILKLIESNMLNNKLFVASIGDTTLAMTGHDDLDGNAVAMIINGSSEMAFQYGTEIYSRCNNISECNLLGSTLVSYEPKGGIGLFSVGVIDTEISSNSNFGRLAKVTFDNNNKLGIGLDKLTALLVRTNDRETVFEVAGIGGVTIVDHSATKIANQGMDFNDISLSYLTLQDSAKISENGISMSYADWKKPPININSSIINFDNLFYSNNFNKFTQQACVSQPKHWSGFAGKQRQFEISLTKKSQTKLMFGGVKIGDQYKIYCSFSELYLSVLRRK